MENRQSAGLNISKCAFKCKTEKVCLSQNVKKRKFKNGSNTVQHIIKGPANCATKSHI